MQIICISIRYNNNMQIANNKRANEDNIQPKIIPNALEYTAK